MSAFSWFPPILSRMNIHQKIQQVVLFERRFPDTTISDMTCPVVSNRDLSEHSRWKSLFFWYFLLCIRFLCLDPWEKTISNRNICLGFFIWYGCFLWCKMSKLYQGTCSKHSWHRTLILIYDGLEVYCCAVWVVNDPVATELLLRKFMLPQTDFNPWVINHFKLKLVQTFQMRFLVFLAHFFALDLLVEMVLSGA